MDINYIDLEDYQYRIFYDLQSYWIIIEESERLKRHHFFYTSTIPDLTIQVK